MNATCRDKPIITSAAAEKKYEKLIKEKKRAKEVLQKR